MNIYEVKALIDVAEAALKFPELKHLHDQALSRLKSLNLSPVAESTADMEETDHD